MKSALFAFAYFLHTIFLGDKLLFIVILGKIINGVKKVMRSVAISYIPHYIF